jgi:CRISPR/Cas system CSM-associated protein Csm3 (group 7 of RAMP superfamily)
MNYSRVQCLHLYGELEAITALHIGSAVSASDGADSGVVRDGAGRLLIPGSSLAGALRAASLALCEGDELLAKAWRDAWGADPYEPSGSGQEGDASGSASLLSIDDALHIGGGRPIEVREYMAIDRRSGAAAAGAQHKRAVITTGTRFALHLALDIREHDDQSSLRKLLFTLAKLLQEGALHIGGGATRGLGSVQLRDPQLRLESFATPEDVLRSLAARRLRRRQVHGLTVPPLGDPLQTVELGVALPSAALGRTEITIHFQPVRALLTRAGGESGTVEALPLTTSRPAGKRTLLLAGASVKGALRSAAERIVRTIREGGQEQADRDATAPLLAGDDELPLVNELFGSRQASGQLAGVRGAISIDDISPERTVSEEAWAAVVHSGTATEAQKLARKGGDLLGGSVVRTSVALDRWTGGAAQEQSSTVLEPRGVRWPPLTISIDSARLPQEKRLLAGALVLLLLRELVAGDLPLGGMVNRGYGELQVKTIKVRRGGALGLRGGRHGTLDVDAAASDDMKAAWLQWAQEAQL